MKRRKFLGLFGATVATAVVSKELPEYKHTEAGVVFKKNDEGNWDSSSYKRYRGDEPIDFSEIYDPYRDNYEKIFGNYEKQMWFGKIKVRGDKEA